MLDECDAFRHVRQHSRLTIDDSDTVGATVAFLVVQARFGATAQGHVFGVFGNEGFADLEQVSVFNDKAGLQFVFFIR
jgi:hypothetical protein